MKRKAVNTRAITLVAVLGAVSAALMAVNFPMPFTPPFLKFDIADMPGLFAGLFLGPGAGAAAVFLKIVIKLLIQGTETMYVGEMMNVVTSLAFTLPAAFLYRRRRDKGMARLALVAGVAAGAVAAVVMNLYVAFPLYARLNGLSIETIVGLSGRANPLVTSLPALILLGVLPFNLIKLGVTSFVTWWLYKRAGSHLRSLVRLPNADDAGASKAA